MIPGKLKNSFILLIAAFMGCAVGMECVFAQPLPGQGESIRSDARNSTQEFVGRETVISGVIDLKNSIIEGIAGPDLEITMTSRADFFIGQITFNSSGQIGIKPSKTQCPELFTEPALETVRFSPLALDNVAKSLELMPLPSIAEMNEELHRTEPWLFIPQIVNIGADSVARCGPLFTGLSNRQEKARRMMDRYESEHAIAEGDKMYCAALLSPGPSDDKDNAEISAAGYSLDIAHHPLALPESENTIFTNGVGAKEEEMQAVETPGSERELVHEPDVNDGATEEYIIFVRGVLRDWDGAKRMFYDQMEEISKEEAGAVATKDGSVIEAVILLESLGSKDDPKDKDNEGEEK